jgi:hypothetical protein
MANLSAVALVTLALSLGRIGHHTRIFDSKNPGKIESVAKI